MMLARLSNIGMRFYELDGWTFEMLQQCLSDKEHTQLIYFKDYFSGYFIFRKIQQSSKEKIKEIISELKDTNGKVISKHDKDFDHIFYFHIE